MRLPIPGAPGSAAAATAAAAAAGHRRRFITVRDSHGLTPKPSALDLCARAGHELVRAAARMGLKWLSSAAERAGAGRGQDATKLALPLHSPELTSGTRNISDSTPRSTCPPVHRPARRSGPSSLAAQRPTCR
eukprot:COSAG01_NODE_5295_length_4352_cov_7.332236_5_plen_133_part_00